MGRSKLRLSLLAVSVGMAFASLAQAQSTGRDHSEAIARLAAESGNGAEVSFHSATGTAQFARTRSGGKLSASRWRPTTDASKQQDFLEFLARHRDLFGIRDAGNELANARASKDRHGHTRVAYQQVYGGVPVYGAELRAHYDASDNLIAVSGIFVPDIDLNTTPTRSATDAAAIAVAYVRDGRPSGEDNLSASTPTLVVFRDGLAKGVPGNSYLAWSVVVGNGADVREFVFVDARTGKVIERFSGIHDGKNRRAFDGAASATAPGPNYPNNPFWVEGNPFPTGNTEADNMLNASSEIYDLFKNAFGRDSFDGAGKRMDSIFNRGWSCPNASWNGTYISFCIGLTTDDITAHEWGHAYTEYMDNLIYAWQPGALNEAYSDIWGETVDRLNGRQTDTPDNARTPGVCSAFTNVSRVEITAPAAIAGFKANGTAAFGPQVFAIGPADVVVVNDGSGTTTDGCQTPFVNAAAVSNKIAFIDRGSCGFEVKVRNAQANGAIGVIIGNNAAGIVNMGGDALADPTIPALSVLQSDGTAIKAQSGVMAKLNRGPGTDNSVRWLQGEDASAPGFSGAIRDMYEPSCYGDPGKVSDGLYFCSQTADNNTDQGGVHTNSGVPNHAYALLVDGGNYNGQTINAIGLTKAAHIYYRAQSVYQGPASDFAAHANAIEQSCSDLKGVNLNSLTNGSPSGQVITQSDCDQVARAALAVELRTPPTQCNFQPLLAKSPPALCPSSSTLSTIASDSFDGGRRAGLRWTVSNVAGSAQFTPRNWGVVNNLPGSRAGYAMYASDPDYSCGGPNQSGLSRLDSPEITVPAGTTDLRMAFDHFVATEPGYDGGNLKISVNGGAWQLVNAADFIYNPYNRSLLTAGGGNSNPIAGQPAFSGTDAGSVTGSWGRSIINLAPYAAPGAKIKLRFELGADSCGGAFGWYVDDVNVYRCTPTP